MAAEYPTRPPPPPIDEAWALFLDVDGTLLAFASEPSAVVVEPALRDSLEHAHRRLDGAVALISGRPLATLDRLFAPLRLPGAGLHGLERRNGGQRSAPAVAAKALQRIRSEAEALSARLHGTVVEDKGVGLGLHWRRPPAIGRPSRGVSVDVPVSPLSCTT